MNPPLELKLGDVVSIERWNGRTDSEWCGHLYEVASLDEIAKGFIGVRILFTTVGGFDPHLILNFHMSNTKFIIP